jgi:hypothetical protein
MFPDCPLQPLVSWLVILYYLFVYIPIESDSTRVVDDDDDDDYDLILFLI